MNDRFPIEEVLQGSDIAGLDPLQVREVIALLARPRVALETPKLAGEWAKIALGLSGIEVPERDAQYGDRHKRSSAVPSPGAGTPRMDPVDRGDDGQP